MIHTCMHSNAIFIKLEIMSSENKYYFFGLAGHVYFFKCVLNAKPIILKVYGFLFTLLDHSCSQQAKLGEILKRHPILFLFFVIFFLLGNLLP